MGAGLMDFVIAIVGLGLILGLFFFAIDYISPDERFKKIGKWAIGGVALLVLLVSIKGVLFGGGGAVGVNPQSLIEFAIGLIVVLLVLFIVYAIIDYFAPEPFKIPVKYIIGGIALIALLVMAGQALFGSGLGFLPGGARHRVLLEVAPLFLV